MVGDVWLRSGYCDVYCAECSGCYGYDSFILKGAASFTEVMHVCDVYSLPVKMKKTIEKKNVKKVQLNVIIT